MTESTISNTAGQLRHLFSTILAHCSPSEPNQLWELFCDQMSDDLVHQVETRNRFIVDGNEDKAKELRHHQAKLNALFEIDRYLNGMASAFYQFPTMPQEKTNSIVGNVAELHCKPAGEEPIDLFAENDKLLNNDQRVTFGKIVTSFKRESDQKVVFADSPGGCGKSFLYNTLIAYPKGVLNKEILVIASQG